VNSPTKVAFERGVAESALPPIYLLRLPREWVPIFLLEPYQFEPPRSISRAAFPPGFELGEDLS